MSFLYKRPDFLFKPQVATRNLGAGDAFISIYQLKQEHLFLTKHLQ